MRLMTGVDLYNQDITGSVAKTLTSARSDVQHIPCVLIENSSGGGIAGTLDSNYYKGCGERQGIEREYIVEGVGDDSRPSDSENL